MKSFKYSPKITGKALVTDRAAILANVFGRAEAGVHMPDESDTAPVFFDQIIDLIVRNEYAHFMVDDEFDYDMPSERVQVEFLKDGQVAFSKHISSIYVSPSAVVPKTRVFIKAYPVYENKRVVLKPTKISYTSTYPLCLN